MEALCRSVTGVNLADVAYTYANCDSFLDSIDYDVSPPDLPRTPREWDDIRMI